MSTSLSTPPSRATDLPRRVIRERFNGIETAETSARSSASIPLLILFGLAMLDGFQVPGTSFPVNSVALILGVVYAVCRRSNGFPRPTWFPLLLVAIPGWLAAASILNGGVDTRRILSITLWAAIALVLSSGRIPIFAAARGIALGITVAGAWALLTIGSSSYEGRLTGWFGDPNTAGLFILTGLCLSLPFLPSKRWKTIVLLVGGAALIMTLSRTSLLAAVFAVAWMVLGGKMNKYLGAAGMAALVYWVVNLPEDAVRFGVFSDREGSDNLRERIEAAEELAVAQNPVIGNGAGTAQVDVDGLFFFFHNSYLALRTEAGWIGLAMMVTLLAGTFLALISLPAHRRSVWAEAAIVSVAVCSANLGEALLAIPTALALGFAGYHIAVQRRALAIERNNERMERWARRLARGQVAGNIS